MFCLLASALPASLPAQWEFLRSWDPERKQPSWRSADWEGMDGVAVWEAGVWKGWRDQEGT